jgi:hypothetical protein
MFRGHRRDLRLAAGKPDWRGDAAQAVKAEFRQTSTLVRLTCRGVEQVGVADDGVFRLDVGTFGHMDWTWEGAKAFKSGTETGSDEPIWSGEIVELDEDMGHLYVAVDAGKPCRGGFVVKPFGFLDALNDFYNTQPFEALQVEIADALAATRGEPARRSAGANNSLPHLAPLWAHGWGVLWGPPGTGKTHTIGRQVAAALKDPTERVLVVSTTNKATDGAAIHVGRGLREAGLPLTGVVRVGSGASLSAFERVGLQALLAGTEAERRRTLGALQEKLRRTTEPEARALLTKQIRDVRQAIKDAVSAFVDGDLRVVMCTAFHALRQLVGDQSRKLVVDGEAPFTTLIVDEAGLLPRATTAALAMLAARRVMLVGDPKQLAPISRMARILPTAQAIWLGQSALGHLEPRDAVRPDVHLLVQQHRMCADIRRVVSEYQYGGLLTDAPSVGRAPFNFDPPLVGQPRAIWIVLDEDDGGNVADIRAERGPGNRSWIRRRTPNLLNKLVKAHPLMARSSVLIITPFKAQARALQQALSKTSLRTWTACTVHAQQGAEADYVIFDTVYAGSTAWPFGEWKRLVNVALSRARQQVFVVASRLEMQEPYMRPLTSTVAPRTLEYSGAAWVWREVPLLTSHEASAVTRKVPGTLGAQLEERKVLRPVLSAEQQRLCGYNLDGKPRLVRGVAGSGKTFVLANWVARTIATDGLLGKAWVVYGNRALHGLLDETIETAWREIAPLVPLPRDRFEIFHVKEVVDKLLSECGLSTSGPFEYDADAKRILEHRPTGLDTRCAALFIDEAQDFGPNTLKLLAGLVESSSEQADHRSVMIFYDNAQNIYGRGTPKWSELGLNMVGRSTVMKESFRATRPIAEFALNTLARLRDLSDDPDHRELLERGLVERAERNGRPWWVVRFNQVDGPSPVFKKFLTRDAELEALASTVTSWIEREGVRPCDIRVLANGKIRTRVFHVLEPALRRVDARIEQQASQTFTKDERTVVLSTAHSFKGYEAEIIALPAADKFETGASDGARPLESALYVALTRARSLLYVSSIKREGRGGGTAIVDALERTSRDLRSPPAVEEIGSVQEDEAVLRSRVPTEHRRWLKRLMERFKLSEEPVVDHGAIVAEPMFTFSDGARRYACFGDAPIERAVESDLEDLGITVVPLGDPRW